MAPYSITITAIDETAVVPMASGPQQVHLEKGRYAPQRPGAPISV